MIMKTASDDATSQSEGAIGTLERVLAQKIRAKQKELMQWQTQREEASRNEEHCLREISEMELAIAVFRRAFGLESDAPPTDDLNVLRYRSQTIASSAFDIMRESGGRARVVDITKTLIKAGKLKPTRTAYASVTKTLDRDDRFTKAGPGTYQIIDLAPIESSNRRRRKVRLT